ncbi:hypothetical protein F5X99DRAFT_414098 [Biscogniauxia marginata]|nr:hypothetical protein F5X99DRAFT_414098 [Biscogniauxia marginata]
MGDITSMIAYTANLLMRGLPTSDRGVGGNLRTPDHAATSGLHQLGRRDQLQSTVIVAIMGIMVGLFLLIIIIGACISYRHRRRGTGGEQLDSHDNPYPTDNTDGAAHESSEARNEDLERGARDWNRTQGNISWAIDARRHPLGLAESESVASWDEQDLAELFEPDSSEEDDEEICTPETGDISLARISTARTVLITPVNHEPRAREIKFSYPQGSAHHSSFLTVRTRELTPRTADRPFDHGEAR